MDFVDGSGVKHDRFEKMTAERARLYSCCADEGCSRDAVVACCTKHGEWCGYMFCDEHAEALDLKVVMNSVKQVLTDAAQLVRGGWTQGAEARDATGQSIEATKPAATCYCLVGAIRRAAPNCELSVESILALRKSPSCPIGADGNPVGLIYWNDTAGRTADEVASFVEKVAAELPDGQ